ncbi:MAG: RluA family pseudouridine synthase, partial [Myxococcota bacterium]|nr:RluA family pseudouridine synthase [Myxococcota bacterium]
DGPTRSQVKAAIERGEVLVCGKKQKAGYLLRAGDELLFTPQQSTIDPLQAQPIPLQLVFEDEHLLVIDKAVGMVVHPAPGHRDGTLVNALLYHGLSAWEEDALAAQRPGIVHRLDRETSGLMVVAKTPAVHAALAAQFAVHSTQRAYLALVHAPHLPEKGRFDTYYGRHPKDRKRFSSRLDSGKRAITEYERLESFAFGAALFKCRLYTGRTHQVRVHLSEHGAPLLGDTVYGTRVCARTALIARPALHAVELGFEHPVRQETLFFEQPPPSDFVNALDALRAGADWRESSGLA